MHVVSIPSGQVRQKALRLLRFNVERFFETPHDNRPNYMLNVTAYVDETKHNVPSEHIVVGGFYGDEEQWKAFMGLWKEALGRKSSLHMNDLRWSGRHAKKRVRDLLARLGPVPYAAGLTPFYGAARVSDYADLVLNASEPNDKPSFAGYVICLSLFLSRLVGDLPPHAIIKVICERQDEYQQRALALFSSASKTHGRNPQYPYLSSIEFIEKGSSAAMEPADFLVFATGKYLDEENSKKDIWCRPVFCGKNTRKCGYVYTRERARSSIQSIIRNTKRAHGRGIWI